MTIPKQINHFRRKLMQRITGNVGVTGDTALPQNANIKHILVCRPNHRLGNMLLITPLVQEVIKTFPGCKIDLFVKGGVAPVVFRKYAQVGQIISLPKKHFAQLPQYLAGWIRLTRKRYDLVINVEERSSSGRLATKLAKSKYKFFGGGDAKSAITGDAYSHIAKKPVYDFRKFLGADYIDREVPPLDIRLSSAEMANGKMILGNLVRNDNKTICLFTYATGSKRLDKSWWASFYTHLKSQYPNYNIIEILPVENVSQFDFSLPTYYSHNIREIASVLSNASLFIGADSGMMHLASSSHCHTMGLFSASSLIKYQPYGPYDVAVNTKVATIEECVGMIRKKFLLAA